MCQFISHYTEQVPETLYKNCIQLARSQSSLDIITYGPVGTKSDETRTMTENFNSKAYSLSALRPNLNPKSISSLFATPSVMLLFFFLFLGGGGWKEKHGSNLLNSKFWNIQSLELSFPAHYLQLKGRSSNSFFGWKPSYHIATNIYWTEGNQTTKNRKYYWLKTTIKMTGCQRMTA